MKENKLKAIGLLKVILRILNVVIFIASVIGIVKILAPKKTVEEVKDEEPDDLDDYMEDVDLDAYDFEDEEVNDESDSDYEEEYDDDDNDSDENDNGKTNCEGGDEL